MVGIPDVEIGEKIGIFIVKLSVDPVGLILVFERSFARVLHADRGCDDQYFAEGVLFAGLEQHPRDSGVDR